MKNIIITGLIGISSIFSYAQPVKKITTGCELGVTLNNSHGKGLAFDSIMKKYSPKILPGMAIALFTEAEGWWAGAAGYANLENKTPMENCHLEYLQSV